MQCLHFFPTNDILWRLRDSNAPGTEMKITANINIRLTHKHSKHVNKTLQKRNATVTETETRKVHNKYMCIRAANKK